MLTETKAFVLIFQKTVMVTQQWNTELKKTLIWKKCCHSNHSVKYNGQYHLNTKHNIKVTPACETLDF